MKFVRKPISQAYIKDVKGRSMIEMLGVLMIAGLLSVGAIAGYTFAMNSHKANVIINEINLRAQDIMIQYNRKMPLTLNEMGTTGKIGVAFDEPVETVDGFYLQIRNVPAGVCKHIMQDIPPVVNQVRVNNTSDQPDDCALQDPSTLVFYYASKFGHFGPVDHEEGYYPPIKTEPDETDYVPGGVTSDTSLNEHTTTYNEYTTQEETPYTTATEIYTTQEETPYTTATEEYTTREETPYTTTEQYTTVVKEYTSMPGFYSDEVCQNDLECQNGGCVASECGCGSCQNGLCYYEPGCERGCRTDGVCQKNPCANVKIGHLDWTTNTCIEGCSVEDMCYRYGRACGSGCDNDGSNCELGTCINESICPSGWRYGYVAHPNSSPGGMYGCWKNGIGCYGRTGNYINCFDSNGNWVAPPSDFTQK